MNENGLKKLHPVHGGCLHRYPLAFDHFSGMTLLEVMIALMIFTMGILAVVSMQNHGLRATGAARQQLNDTTAVVRQLELLLALGYDHEQLVDQDLGFEPQHPDHGPVPVVSSNATFLEWEVGDDLPIPGTKRIQVTLHRPKGSISFQGLKADPGPLGEGAGNE